MSINGKTKVNSVGKAIKVMELLHKARRSLSIKEIADELGMHKSTLHHLVSTLTEFGFLSQDPETRKYHIGLHLVEIGQAYLEQLDLKNTAHPFLERLAMEAKETVHLMILDQYDAVYIDKLEDLTQLSALRCSSYIGRRASAYSTAAGKVLLAHLPPAALHDYLACQKLTPITEHTITNPQILLEQLKQIKKAGFALDLQENEVGLQCVAAPVFDLKGRCIAALSISGPVSRMSTPRIEKKFKPLAKSTAKQISQALGFSS